MQTARQILDRKGSLVATIGREVTVLDAAKKMNDMKIGALVVAESDRVIGMFTERDILCRIVAAQRDAAAIKVGDVMTTPVACCQLSSPMTEIQSVMTSKRIRHLPVVEDGKLVGMISSGDVLFSQVAEQQSTIQYLHDYIHGR